MKNRYELTDPAISSRKRLYGPTDLGEKGMETFFSNHRCNEYCNTDKRWSRPRNPVQWFPLTEGTSMLSSSMSRKLELSSNVRFKPGVDGIIEEDSDFSDY
mmetsp:Transcript_49303/g.139591  ORF Transcript_49303/g.139591 Transcript_49303/m.139591 type:complete len:101 (+) Transcript_49303:660-962(+)